MTFEINAEISPDAQAATGTEVQVVLTCARERPINDNTAASIVKLLHPTQFVISIETKIIP